MAHDVFISYSAKNKTTGDAVCATLESNGIRCWIAPRDVVPGMEWGECIIEAIEQARIMVLVFTADANASPQIRREVERAVNHGVAILPLRTENVAPGRALEYFIGNVHWLDALTPPFEAHLKNLAGTVNLLLSRMGAREASPSPHATAGEEAQTATPQQLIAAASPEHAAVSPIPHPIEAVLGKTQTASSKIAPEICPEPARASSTETVEAAAVSASAQNLDSGYSEASTWKTDPSRLIPQRDPADDRSEVSGSPTRRGQTSRARMIAILGGAVGLIALLVFFKTREAWSTHFINAAGWLYSITGTSDGKRLWAAGQFGTIWESNDGGTNWTVRSSGSTKPLNAILATGDGRRLWAVGEGGTILESDDGGGSWIARKSGTTVALASIFGTSDGQRLWVVGNFGTILRSDDGGVSWKLRSDGRTDLDSIYGTSDGKRLWAAGAWKMDGTGAILESDDGGATWTARSSGARQKLNSIFATGNGQRLWAVGYYGTFLESDNGGAIWTMRDIGSKDAFRSILATGDGKRLWIVGGWESCTILDSNDGGANWTARSDGNSALLNSVFANSDGTRVWAVGGYGIVAQASR